MKKFLHLMKKEKFTDPISGFYNAYFSKEGHEICYMRFEGEESLINQELEIKQFEFILPAGNIRLFRLDLFARFDDLIKKYDYIVLHSMFLPFWFIWMVTRSRKIEKKFIWIEWGYDLYNYQPKAKNIKEIFIKSIKTRIREHCNTVVCIFPPDCDYYKEKFPNHSANVVYAPYCGAKVPEEYHHYSKYSRLHQTNLENDTVWIQIGHSATGQIDHIAILHALERFKNEDIMILLPLSYGDVELANKVQEYAEKTFPGKTLCLREFMPSAEYFKLLSRVDIAIFNTDRQIALANINRLAFRNTKIYLKDDSIMFNYFLNRGVPVQPVSIIEKQNFNDFRMESKGVEKEKFQEYIDELSDMNRKISLWRGIYNEMIRGSNANADER